MAGPKLFHHSAKFKASERFPVNPQSFLNKENRARTFQLNEKSNQHKEGGGCRQEKPGHNHIQNSFHFFVDDAVTTLEFRKILKS